MSEPQGNPTEDLEAKYDEECEFCGAGPNEDCGPECPTQAKDPLAAIGIPPAENLT